MSELMCPNPNCHQLQAGAGRTVHSIATAGPLRIRARVTCTSCYQSYPIEIERNIVVYVRPEFEGEASKALRWEVPELCRQALREAELCFDGEAYLGAVAMCRRAVQAGLLDKGVHDGPLTAMLNNAFQKGLLPQKTLVTATAIKAFGDAGAHPKDDEWAEITKEEVPFVLVTTRNLLNELFKEDPEVTRARLERARVPRP